ncbi:MAG: MBL fold hydrolase [Legionella sp. 40-6]|nr:MAG: MBL fold hydrolase [Legionella sp. 40-6]
MKLQFLGAGSGLGRDLSNYQSNMLLLSDTGKTLLIDCGTDIRFSLANAQYLPNQIDAVYISHLHADHVGGLEWFALQRKFIYQNRPLMFIHEELAPMLWDHSLSGGLKTLDELDASLEDFFIVHKVKCTDTYEWEGIKFNLVKTVHIHSNGQLMPSFGLFIEYQQNAYFLTTDTRFIPDKFQAYYEKAKIIFHDCETLARPSGVHAHYSELLTLPQAIKNKIWLYHYDDGILPEAQQDGFRGFVQCGQVIELA